MKLLCIFAAVLAVSLSAESGINNEDSFEDMVAAETMELMKEGQDLIPAASAYSYVPSNQNYAPPNQNNYFAPAPPVVKPWNPPAYAPQNPPVWTPPHQQPFQPIHTHVPTYAPPHNNVPHWPTQSTWAPTKQPIHHTTTTPSSLIKNEINFGSDGSYNYEYKISDGTHVSEQGYYTDPKHTDESVVKKGSYSFTAADGKVYTVNWWADHTGFHAFGDHLPTPPPVPAAIQASLDQAEAEKNKPNQQVIHYPSYSDGHTPVNYPQQQYPQQPVYQPPQTFYPPQQHNPTYG